MRSNAVVADQRLATLRQWSQAQARSKQARLGMSEVGGPCDRATVYRLLGQETTNPDTQVLAALRGTAVHRVLEMAIGASLPGARTEVEVEYRGLLGHLDLTEPGVVEDHKTKTAKGMKAVRNYGADRGHVWQLHLYAAGLMRQGEKIHTLRLVYYSVDTVDDVLALEMTYDPAITEQAIGHYEHLLTTAMNGELPPPAKDPGSWCALYCRFYDATGQVGCAGRTAKPVGYDNLGEMWGEADPDGQAAQDYRHGMDLEAQGKAIKEAAREKLIGARGVVDGLAVSWTNPQPKEVPDTEAALRRLDQLGEPIPMTIRQASSTISVKPVHP